MVQEEWVPLEEPDVVVVPIAEVRWEVVAEQVAPGHVPFNSQMVRSNDLKPFGKFPSFGTATKSPLMLILHGKKLGLQSLI